MKVKAMPRQSLADIAIQVYGDIRAVVDIAAANSLSITADLEAGMELECPDVVYDPFLQVYVKQNVIIPATASSEFDEPQPNTTFFTGTRQAAIADSSESDKGLIVRARQCLADIAIQVYGDIRAVVDLAAVNGLSITADIEAGVVLECPDIVYDQYLQTYVRKNGVMPATALSELDEMRPRIFTDQFTKEFK